MTHPIKIAFLGFSYFHRSIWGFPASHPFGFFTFDTLYPLSRHTQTFAAHAPKAVLTSRDPTLVPGRSNSFLILCSSFLFYFTPWIIVDFSRRALLFFLLFFFSFWLLALMFWRFFHPFLTINVLFWILAQAIFWCLLRNPCRKAGLAGHGGTWRKRGDPRA